MPKHSRTGKVLKFPLRKWEETHSAVSFLCNDYVIPEIACIQSSQSISNRFFIDKDVNFIVLYIQPMLSETLTESVLLKH